jgi:hypothetical protein
VAARSPEREALVVKTLASFEQDLKTHRPTADKYDERYRAYRGVIEARSPAAQWTNKAHPHIALQSIETMVANLIDPSPKWRLRAKPIVAEMAEVARMREGARANELLLSHQLTLDKYAEKQRPFDLQALICGVTAAKQSWMERKGPKRYLETEENPVYGMFDRLIGTAPRLRERTREVVYRDDPTSEVVDVRHLIFPENATSMERLDRLAHRMWFSFEELEELVKNGHYGPDAGGEAIDDLKESRGFTDGEHNREQDLFGVKVTRDKIEVVEHWVERGRRVVTIANRKVLLADKKNPFWFDHLDHPFPFVVCSSMPDLFRIPGISEVELMQDLQEMLWTLMNQRLDSLQLLANAIFLIADDVDDPTAFEFAPGEQWLVPRPVDETVKAWSPDPNVPRMTIEAEQLLQNYMQTVTGSMPFMSGDSGGADNSTATGVSIITTLAQKRIAAKKQQFVWAKSRIGEQWCGMNQQFVRSERLVPVVGKEGAEDFMAIQPDLLQGVYLFETEMVDDSLMRSERRAEAQAKLQVASGVVGIFAELSQVPGAGTPALNMKAFMDDYLEAFDITDKERYYVAAPVPAPAPPPQPGAAPNGNGVTNPALAAGPTSPSNPESMSPEVFASRALAETGGAVNR